MTDLTLIFELGPPLVITLFLLFFVRSHIYKRICITLILVLWASVSIGLLKIFGFGVLGNDVWSGWIGSSQGVNDGVLMAQFGLSMFQSVAFVFEQLLLWGFVAFFAVIIGSIYLFITCLKRKGGSLSEKMSKVSFKTTENPLVSKMDVDGLEKYLIIGLVTMPSMVSISMGMRIAGYSVFSISVVYYVLLFYRFSLMAYARIARKADLHIDKEDIGRKYEKRMIGWFTILNLFISAVILGYTLLFMLVPLYALAEATIVELQSLLVAILILPFVEGFAVLFFSRFWRFWARLGTRLRGINGKLALYSVFRGILISGACFVLFYCILSFVTATATQFSTGVGPVFNVDQGTGSIYDLTKKIMEQFNNLATPGYIPTLPPFAILMLPALWALVAIFLFQFIKFLIGGALTHRKNVAPEYSTIVASIVMGLLIWWIIPTTNFILQPVPVGIATDAGLSTMTQLLVPQPFIGSIYYLYQFIPTPTDVLYILFLDFPIWMFGSLFFMYFFKFRRDLIPAKRELGPFRADDFFKLFVSFCVVIVASIGTLVAIDPITLLGDFVHGLISRLWFPNYREQAIFTAVGPSWIFFHNMIRFMLTVFAPMLLWVSVIGFWKYLKNRKQKSYIWYILGVVVLALEAIILVDRFTYIAIIVIPLVLAALYRWIYRAFKRAPPKTMFRTTFLKISFYSLILSEIYSTAIAIADRYMFPIQPPTPSFYSGGSLGLLSYLLILIPHGLIEIPAAMLAALIGLYIARRMTAALDEDEKNLDRFIDEGNKLVFSRQVWYPILFVTIFFAVAAVIEIYITWSTIEPLVNAFGFA